MPSIQSSLFYGLLKTINIETFLYRNLEEKKRKKRVFFSKREFIKFNISTVLIDHKEVSTIGKDLETPLHVIYFHGGMYVLEATRLHKRWLVNLFLGANCKVTTIDYPLAPENIFTETIQMVVRAYQFLSGQYPHDRFVLMGDSSGGGLALALAQYLRDHDFDHRPEKLALYSPWVNLAMNTPGVENQAKRDALLDASVLKRSAQAYAGGADLSHPYLSPYFGNCADLGAIHVFCGDDELLSPNLMLFEQKCHAENEQAVFYRYEGMQHVFQLFTFLPESKDVLDKTLEILR